jgi:cytochrome c peroxidase
MLEREICLRLKHGLLWVGAAALALAACGGGDERPNPDSGQIHPAGVGGSSAGSTGAGGSGGAPPPPPDAGTPGNPVAEPPMGLDPNNQVNPGPLPGDAHFNFAALRARGEMLRGIMDPRQAALLQQRYDLSDRPSSFTMTRGKPLQDGVRVRLPSGVSWEELAGMTPEQIKARDLFPGGFMPLPHPNQDEGGMILPQSTIDEINRQTARNLRRFDISFDIPEIFIPEFPPAIFLTTRPDLGDVSQGKVVTFANFFELFKDKLTQKQLDGFRLLLTPFPQQQFNLTDDRRTVDTVLGIGCLECHINGHTNAATHLVQDIRPQEMRNRIDTPTLRGVNIQRLFGSQRALKTVEDFTEFEQSGAYFDGDMASAKKKGLNMLDRTQEVQPMAELQELFDFPPAPKLNVFGTLDAGKATSAELRGEIVFNGKGQCAVCHPPPFYTDLTMHDLMVDRFFTFRTVNNQIQKPDGLIKTFPLRGIKDSPPYFHDGRLLTLEDTIEFFNLILEDHLTQSEKDDLLAFLLAL